MGTLFDAGSELFRPRSQCENLNESRSSDGNRRRNLLQSILPPFASRRGIAHRRRRKKSKMRWLRKLLIRWSGPSEWNRDLSIGKLMNNIKHSGSGGPLPGEVPCAEVNRRFTRSPGRSCASSDRGSRLREPKIQRRIALAGLVPPFDALRVPGIGRSTQRRGYNQATTF